MEPPDRLVGARMIGLDDFCRIRLIEVLIHIDDLAVSVREQPSEPDSESMTIVFDVLLEIARSQHGDRRVLHAFSRAVRETEPPVFPLVRLDSVGRRVSPISHEMAVLLIR